MADHQIIISQFPQPEVLSKDVEFEIRPDDDLVGFLGISKGTLSWSPSHDNRRNADWEKLNKLSENWEKW